MAFRELSVIEVREILGRWQRGSGIRTVAAQLGADRKTVRRYVEAAKGRGLSRDADSRALDDDLLAEVIAAVLPGAPPQAGAARQLCRDHRELIESWLDEGCKSPKITRLLYRHTGVLVPGRTLRRFIQEELAQDKRGTVRIVAPPPGQVLEIDFMEVGRVTLGGEAVKLLALVCVATFSRHCFVWPCLSQDREHVIEGLEAAWSFFGGVFPVVVFDNPKTVVLRACALAPKIAEDLLEYAQSRGFTLDLARVRRPQDKPKVERTVSYTRSDCFAGERLLDLAHARRHAVAWCRDVAGQRVHGATRKKPLEVFLADDQPLLLPAPDQPYDTPTWVTLKVGRDHAVSVAHALYSVPHALRGRTLRVRYDRQTVRLYDKGAIVKVHPRVAAGEARIDPVDLPPGTAELATRDAEGLQARAARSGEAVGEYASRLLAGKLPWTRMRHVYRLMGLCKRFGDPAVEQACRTALELDVVDVTRIARMLELDRAPGSSPPPPPSRGGKVLRPRFGRDPAEFRTHTDRGSDAT